MRVLENLSAINGMGIVNKLKILEKIFGII